MRLNTVIFDMDGLLIDSEPLWYEAACEVFVPYGIRLTPVQYATTTGLRTKEFIQWWFRQFAIHGADEVAVDRAITQAVISKIVTKGKTLPGVSHVLNYFIDKKYKIGLASSSDLSIIDVVVDKLGIRNHLAVIESAEQLQYGKPHPQVYLNCAAALNSDPTECICFEDSFNGMISAKAARMKCIVVPAASERQHPKFGAADLRLSSLNNFNGLLLEALQ